jgi:hypothetical protein
VRVRNQALIDNAERSHRLPSNFNGRFNRQTSAVDSRKRG